MKAAHQVSARKGVAVAEPNGADLLQRLVGTQPSSGPSADRATLVIGELVAMTDDGRTPLVLYSGPAGSAAVAARSVVDLHAAHIGCRVVLMFEGADATRPIVMGVLREGTAWPLEERPGTVAVDADGERLVVSAKEQLVLRCGKASITLTRSGKVLIAGAYVSSRSSGVNRVKGGSIQIN